MAHQTRLMEFIEKTLILDNLIDARTKDIEFIKKGGRIYLTPDKSTWGAFFFPVQDGAEHKGERGVVDGFAEIYPEADKSDEPYVDGSALSAKNTSGMLGKILIDSIFSPSEETHAPAFFLTDESRIGLNETLEHFLRVRQNRSMSWSEHKTVFDALSQLKKNLAAFPPEKGFANLAVNPEKASPAWIQLLMNDANPTNLNERARAFNKLRRIDIQTLVDSVDPTNETLLRFGLIAKDLEDLGKHSEEFSAVLSSGLRNTAADKIRSISEILALNLVIGRKTDGKTRFLYLTNSSWAVTYFDKFSWDLNADEPLKPFDEDGKLKSVAKLFVRNPLCFLQDIESRAFELGPDQPLKIFVDTIVPRHFRNARRLGVNDRKRHSINNTLKKNINQLEFYDRELTKFYKSWGLKKRPWVNLFLAKRGVEWQPEFEVFDKEGFQAFWTRANEEFAKSAWKMGIYLAAVSEIGPARAVPLVHIDCDRTTNGLLIAMQRDLSTGKMRELGIEIERFNTRETRGQSKDKVQYFDALVNAVLFMFCNQFNTSETYAGIACDIAARSDDEKITGREALYLRSHLVRVTARDHRDFDRARKYMLLARSKLSEDNRLMPEAPVSSIRFDLEDWSRKIVEAMPPISRYGEGMTPRLLNEYLSFARNAVENNFGITSDEEKELLPRVCGKMKFNFMVLVVSIESFGLSLAVTADEARRQIVLFWNDTIGLKHEDLRILVTRKALKDSSTIEKAYLLSLAMAAPGADFIDGSIDLANEVNKFFGIGNKYTIDSAKTSRVVDHLRYEKLIRFCTERLIKPTEAPG